MSEMTNARTQQNATKMWIIAGIILSMGLANERRCYYLTSSLIGHYGQDIKIQNMEHLCIIICRKVNIVSVDDLVLTDGGASVAIILVNIDCMYTGIILSTGSVNESCNVISLAEPIPRII